jgi:methyltransferase-like protein/2-polyprenyl-3-methyl-5-hydroxy-6-metoxy-1,4-benzoquinol methylase
MINTAIAQAYGSLAYPSHPTPDMHPGRLAVMARLFNLNSADPAHCRVLELGCGSGGSTIPFCYTLPGSTFLAIDLTPASIEAARAVAEKLKLTNVEFRCADILTLPDDLGTFDYIVAHGVYSWVPHEVREKMLAICQRHLAPNGVAYISYNARPGSDLRTLMREIMLYQSKNGPTPAARVKQARAVVEFIATAKESNEIFNQVMQWNHERIERIPDDVLFHDDLGTINQPFFFHEFVRDAARHELQYLGEMNLFSMSDRRFEPPTRELLERLGQDLLTVEQYMDFLGGRAFRQTLLCHENAQLDRNVGPDRLRNLWFASQFEPSSTEPQINSPEIEEFRTGPKRTVKTNHPMAKAILTVLGADFPRCLTFEQLVSGVRVHLGPVEPSAVGEAVLEMTASGPALELSAVAPPCAPAISERPCVNALARLQALQGAPQVTNLRCCYVGTADPLLRRMLQLADGTRDRDAMAKELTTAIESGSLPRPEEAKGSEKPLTEVIAAGLERNLKMACRFSLLEA